MLLAKRDPVAVPSAERTGVSWPHLFLRGFVSQIVNPKAVIFYGALFPQFLTPGGDVVAESSLLAATEAAIEFVILLGYGTLAAQGSRLASRPRFGALADKVAGMFLVGAGLGLATMRRS